MLISIFIETTNFNLNKMDAELYNEQSYELNINLTSKSFLSYTAKWGKFLSIMGFIFVGLMVVGGLFATTFMSAVADGAGFGNGMIGGAFLGIFYLAFALLYFFPVLYLYKFSTKMETGLRMRDEEVVTDSFRNLKSLFKFMGVLTIVMLAFYALMLIAVTIGAGISASM